jgi:hypothetical protein
MLLTPDARPPVLLLSAAANMPSRTLSGGEDFDMDGGYGRRRRGLGSQRGEANKKEKIRFFFRRDSIVEQKGFWFLER